MQISNINNFKNGWIIGNFEPSLFKTEYFEVGVHEYAKGHKAAPHYHKLSTEYNYILSGKMIVNGVTLLAGSIFVLEPYEVSEAEFLEQTTIIIARNHSNTKDKYTI